MCYKNVLHFAIWIVKQSVNVVGIYRFEFAHIEKKEIDEKSTQSSTVTSDVLTRFSLVQLHQLQYAFCHSVSHSNIKIFKWKF